MRTIALTIVIFSSVFLFGMVNNSDAQIEIIDMYVPSDTSNNDDEESFYLSVYLDTNIPFSVVFWYIGDPDDPSDRKPIGDAQGDGIKTRAYFYPDGSDCPGHVKGKKYRLYAEVWYHDDDNHSVDYDSRDFTVFRSISTFEVVTPPKIMHSVKGYSELTRQYYTGKAIIIDCFVYAYNPYETNIRAWSRFKHFLTDKQTIVREHPNPNGVDAQRIGGKYGPYSHSDILPHFDINLQEKEYTSHAYVRLLVVGRGEDSYFVENTERFTSDDRPYDAPDNDE